MKKKDNFYCGSSQSGNDDFDYPEPASLSTRTPTELDERNDARNAVPEWVMCSDANGQDVVVFSKAQIVNGLAAGFDLWQRFQQTPPNRNRRQYPQFYRGDSNTPQNLGGADRRQAFPIIVCPDSNTNTT